MVGEVAPPPGGGETVLVISRADHPAAGQAVLHPVNPRGEALVALPAVVVDQPGLHHLPHVGQQAGLVQEDEDAGDGLHGEEDEDEAGEESEPSPGVLDDPAHPGDAHGEDQQAAHQHRETHQSEQVLPCNQISSERRPEIINSLAEHIRPAAAMILRNVPLLL